MKTKPYDGKRLKSILAMMPFIAGSSLYVAGKAYAEDSDVPQEAPSVTANDCALRRTGVTISDQDAAEAKSTIDDIAIHIHPIFDEENPKENNWVFRTVNALHINTHKYVIKNDLLFEEGDVVDGKLIDESERRLRTRSYLSRVTIDPTNPCGETTSVNVDVHEVWTLVPELSYSHTGGKNSYGYGLHDSNFLGLGKTLNLIRSSDIDRTGTSVQYKDPNTGFLDTTLELMYADNDDGVHKVFEFVRPFASLTTDWTAGYKHQDFEQEDTLYDLGKEANRFSHINKTQSVFYGQKLNFSSRESIHRVLVGYTRSHDDFTALTDQVDPKDNSIYVPGNRQFEYPWIEYQHIDDDYIKAYNVRQINRVEDINLGSDLRVRIGQAKSDFELYDGAVVFDAALTKGFSVGTRQLLLTEVTANGFHNDGEFFSGVVKGVAAYHWQNFERGQFYVQYTEARGYNQFPETPLELGGDEGLRGYPSRYQAGDHLQLVNVEQRYYGQKEWFSLFHMGAAIFYDQGRAYGDNPIPIVEHGWLRDVGVGLRISGTRTGNSEGGEHNVLHMDVAYPLDAQEDKDISKVQWLVSVKTKF